MNNAKLVSEYSSFFNETTEAQFIKKNTTYGKMEQRIKIPKSNRVKVNFSWICKVVAIYE